MNSNELEHQNSFENILNSMVTSGISAITTTSNDFSICDFNNCTTADRKLIINNSLEFWVHDSLLINSSSFFENLFSEKQNNSNILHTETDHNIKITSIDDFPNSEFVFDILIWIYGRNDEKLKKISKKHFNSFLSLLNLGIYLKMKENYFEILLSDLHKFNWDISAFTNQLWSCSVFTFPILERIVKQMPQNNYNKIIALLYWLKNSKDKKSTLISHDLFYVRNYMKYHKLMNTLSLNQIVTLKKQFNEYTSALDINGFLNQFIIGGRVKCLVCKKEFNNQNQVKSECKAKGEEAKFHPPCALSKIEKNICNHEGCHRKYNKNEYICCHKKIDIKNGDNNNNNGCQIGEGNNQTNVANPQQQPNQTQIKNNLEQDWKQILNKAIKQIPLAFQTHCKQLYYKSDSSNRTSTSSTSQNSQQDNFLPFRNKKYTLVSKDSFIEGYNFEQYENFEGYNAKINPTEAKSLRFVNCLNCTFTITNKISEITLINCEDTKVYFDSVISQFEMLNCINIKVQCNKSLNDFNIYKCKNIKLYLYKDSKHVPIYVSNSTEINLRLFNDQDENEYVDYYLPEQVCFRVDEKMNLITKI